MINNLFKMIFKWRNGYTRSHFGSRRSGWTFVLKHFFKDNFFLIFFYPPVSDDGGDDEGDEMVIKKWRIKKLLY